MENIESKIINDWLKDQAKNPDNQPLFRLVWSDDTYELRKGTFCLYNGDILIREQEGTDLVPKYPDIEHRWVFEQWYPPELVWHEDLPNSKDGSYEPLYVFETKKGKVLPLNLEVIKFLVNRIMRPKSSPEKIKFQILNDLLDKEELQVKFDEEYLDVSTDIQSNLHFGEAIIVPANYPVESPNLRRKQ